MSFSHAPRYRMPTFPPAVKWLAIINVAVFLLSAILRWTIQWDLAGFMAVGWNEIQEGYGLGLLRFVSSLFAHASDPWHLVGNLLILGFLGPVVHSETGDRGLVHLYLVGGVFGGLGHIGLAAIAGHDAPAIGASGACYAIAVYLAFMAPRLRIFFNFEARYVIGTLVAIGVYTYLSELFDGWRSGTSHGGHLGGAFYGALAFNRFRGYYLKLQYKGGALFPAVSRWKEDRQRKSRVDEQKTLDRLLEKVGREGMGALTGAERRFLEKASKRRRGS